MPNTPSRRLARPGIYLYDRVQAEKVARKLSQDPDHPNVDVGLYADIVWADLESNFEGALKKLLPEPGGEKLPVVIRFKAVEPRRTLPALIQNSPELQGTYYDGGVASQSINKAGWELSTLQDAHKAMLADLVTWLKAHDVQLGWIEVGSYGIWGEWHFNPDSLIGGLYATAATAAIYAKHWAETFGEAWPSLPYIVAYDLLLHESDATHEEPAFALAKNVQDHLGEFCVRMDMIGSNKQTRQFEKAVAAAAKAGIRFGRDWGGEGANGLRLAPIMTATISGKTSNSPPPKDYPLKSVTAFGGQLSGGGVLRAVAFAKAMAKAF